MTTTAERPEDLVRRDYNKFKTETEYLHHGAYEALNDGDFRTAREKFLILQARIWGALQFIHIQEIREELIALTGQYGIDLIKCENQLGPKV